MSCAECKGTSEALNSEGNMDACRSCFDKQDQNYISKKEPRQPAFLKKRKKNRTTIRKPSMIAPLPTTVRTCLSCGTKFESQGVHNRMCNPCRLLPSSPFEPHG